MTNESGKSSGFNCMYTNANSILDKMEEFRERVIVGHFDIIGITETWASQDILDTELTIDGYTLYRNDRLGRVGGGVALYIKETLQATLKSDLTNSDFQESIWCEVYSGRAAILVGVIYRCPSSAAINNGNLLKLISTATQQSSKKILLIMGDFNYPEIKFQDGYVQAGPDSEPAVFYRLVEDSFLTQHITEPTRMREGDKPSTLDYILTNEEELIEDGINYEVPMGKSDHVVLTWKITVSAAESNSQRSKFNYWKGNYAAMNAYLKDVDWEGELEGCDIEGKWKFFKDTVLSGVKKFIPIKRATSRKKNPWITKQTIQEMKKRADAWREYRDHPCKTRYKEYTVIRNRVNRMVHADKENYNQTTLDSFKGNPKRFYGYIRNLKTVKAQVTQLKKADGSLTSDDYQAAELLCEYFQEIFTKEIDQDSQEAKLLFGNTEDQIVFDTVLVHRQLLKLKIDKSPGPDELHPMILKECADSLAEPLAKIFQSSFADGHLPADWKMAEICPIFKKGHKSDPGNYRPVSLTSVVCKVMESVVRDHLLQYLEERNLISSKQHGFIHGRSCLTNLLETFEEWTAALDEGYGIDVIYMDYKKAFDMVPHGRLVKKMNDYGIDDKILLWIKDFLSNRKMRVSVKGCSSSWREVLSGVPQGSVLGPLLFLIYVNDIPEWMLSSIRLFADDTKLWTRISGPEDVAKLQQDLNRLQQWSDEWLLAFNINKCKVMHVGHNGNDEYFLQDKGQSIKLEAITEEKDLGVFVTANMKPSKQCITSAKKARSVLGLIHRHFRKFSKAQFLTIYKTYIRPHLEYAIQAWSPWLQKDIDCLERVQRRATKLVAGLRNLSYEQRLERLNLTTLEERRRRGDLIETFKLLKGKESIGYQQFFQRDHNPHGLRGNDMKLFVPAVRTELRKNFFSHRVLKAWNGLPQSVVEVDTVNGFKTRYDRFIKDMGK